MPVQKNILLVEDEPTLQRILGSVLGDAGHLVTAMGTAEQALERLDDGNDIDLVLTDKNLPALSGLDLLSQVRAGEKRGKRLIGVMMVTGYPSRDSALQALDDDADGYLVKPFRSLSHAVELIQRVLDGDLVDRRHGPPLARKVARALAGLPEPLAGLDVAVVADPGLSAALAAAGARLVDDVAAAQVVVAANLTGLLAGRRSPRAGLVLVDGGATFQQVVELIAAGGGAIVDRGLVPTVPGPAR
ncbi:MAG: response regulator [Deltaproteobacteria bacterium]|nr:response regulator [Deltaproteobacteria bacterium]